MVNCLKLAALFSGGKDSTFAIYLAEKAGHEVTRLLTVHSKNPESYMYHTPNISLTLLLSISMGKELVTIESKGEKEKEVQDLETLLGGLDVDGVVCGAIASEYQKQRVDNVCKKLGLQLIAPLWHQDPEKLLRDLLKAEFEAVITQVAAEGFNENWLGRKIDENGINDLKELNRKYGIHMSGEGGEYESLVLDCPLFRKRLNIVECRKVWSGNSGTLLIENAKLTDKS